MTSGFQGAINCKASQTLSNGNVKNAEHYRLHCITRCSQMKLEDRSQKKKIMFLHSKNKASRKGYKGEC